MAEPQRYAYVQARVQARLGRLPSPTAWQRLEAITALGHFLQTARSSGLRPWLHTIGPQSGAHEVEGALRRHLRNEIDEVARWLPTAWRPAAWWCAVLPDLPALQHLLRGEPAPEWLRRDPWLRPYGHDLQAVRLQALRESAYAPLLVSTEAEDGLGISAAWSRHWHRLWPHEGTDAAGVAAVEQAVADHFATLRLPATRGSVPSRGHLEQRLRRLLRRSRGRPAAAFAYLTVAGIHMERLRGKLARLIHFHPAEAA